MNEHNTNRLVHNTNLVRGPLERAYTRKSPSPPKNRRGAYFGQIPRDPGAEQYRPSAAGNVLPYPGSRETGVMLDPLDLPIQIIEALLSRPRALLGEPAT